jgi:hypothetical protein
VQNLRRGHYEITVDVLVHDRLRLAVADPLAVSLAARIATSNGWRLKQLRCGDSIQLP